jgi:hypothetical protein
VSAYARVTYALAPYLEDTVSAGGLVCAWWHILANLRLGVALLN